MELLFWISCYWLDKRYQNCLKKHKLNFQNEAWRKHQNIFLYPKSNFRSVCMQGCWDNPSSSLTNPCPLSLKANLNFHLTPSGSTFIYLTHNPQSERSCPNGTTASTNGDSVTPCYQQNGSAVQNVDSSTNQNQQMVTVSHHVIKNDRPGDDGTLRSV